MAVTGGMHGHADPRRRLDGRRARRTLGEMSVVTPPRARPRPRESLLSRLPTSWPVTFLALASLLSASATLLVPGLLTGPPVMNGSAKGTAAVILLLGTPVLVLADVQRERRRPEASSAWSAVLVGASGYLLYNAVLMLFGTPFNRAFLLYEVTLGLALLTFVVGVTDVWTDSSGPPLRGVRWTAGYLLVVTFLNGLAWLRRLVPAMFADDPRSILTGTGLPTSPVYVQDLAFWLPTIAWVGIGMWKGHQLRVVLGAAALTYWVLEAVSVAVDQWWGHHADPASPVAAQAAVPLFVLIGLVTLWPLRQVLSVVAAADMTAASGGEPDPSPMARAT